MTLKLKKLIAKLRMPLKNFSLSLYYLHNLFNFQFTIHNIRDFLGHNLSIKKADLLLSSGKILLKHKRINIFFCIFLAQVEKDKQIVVISNNSNKKWKTKLILYKQRQIWDHLKLFFFFQLRKSSVKKLVGALFCFDCMITRKFYFWDGTNAI